MNMNMKEAEIWIESDNTKKIQNLVQTLQDGNYRNEQNIRNDIIESNRIVWIGGHIKKHIKHNNWKAVVDDIYDLFQQ